MRPLDEIDAPRAELKTKRAHVQRDLDALDAYEVRSGEWVLKRSVTPGDRERSENLTRGLARLDEQDAALA